MRRGERANMERHTCIFCGNTRMVVYKQISKVDVLDIVNRQLRAGIRDPAIVFLANFTQCLRAHEDRVSLCVPDMARDAGVVVRGGDTACSMDEGTGSVIFDVATAVEHGIDSSSGVGPVLLPDDDMDACSCASVDHLSDDCDTEVEEIPIQCCICCFHWVTRRKKLAITVLPMQCLLYFILGIDTVEMKQCDTRVLTRLTMTIGEEKSNIWRSVFNARELEAIDAIAVKKKMCPRTEGQCCVKRELGAFYHAQNGNSMLLASRSVADILRAPMAARL